jgi:hypothetical protein
MAHHHPTFPSVHRACGTAWLIAPSPLWSLPGGWFLLGRPELVAASSQVGTRWGRNLTNVQTCPRSENFVNLETFHNLETSHSREIFDNLAKSSTEIFFNLTSRQVIVNWKRRRLPHKSCTQLWDEVDNSEVNAWNRECNSQTPDG